MRVVLTTCSAEKRADPGLLPAVARYTHPRVAAAAALAAARGEPLLILSGVYGLLDAQDPVPWYDHALQVEEIDALVPRVRARAAALGVTAVTLLAAPRGTPGWAPYFAVVDALAVPVEAVEAGW